MAKAVKLRAHRDATTLTHTARENTNNPFQKASTYSDFSSTTQVVDLDMATDMATDVKLSADVKMCKMYSTRVIWISYPRLLAGRSEDL